ncbi:MAG TPA: hypothetical protein DIC45_00180 [Comamonadaceae bacterium]|uniref:LPS translocon maturation chaperone LptM n=1 Tax=Pulveribacter sp. TaxID=2678893 RepID=UPI000EE863F2|nr:lipoprotein [Pulveribacter sp.]HCL84945.1 hypothetical protein [Comamonadaceae bacterium]
MLTSRRILASTLCLAAAVASLAACGQRGPLYLPTEPAAAQRASLPDTLRPAPAAAVAPTAPASSTSTRP